MIAYPTAEEYARAVQHPEQAFARGELSNAAFPRSRGYVMPSSGSRAVVFHATVGRQDEALRFFTSPSASSIKQRYDALQTIRRDGLTRHIPRVSWVDTGVRVRDQWWPMLRMDWVCGAPLDEHVDDLVSTGRTASLSSLTRQWRGLVARMQAQNFAHGDLQHGNVLVDGEGVLRLVDFDGIWTDSLAHLEPPGEAGHPNYQPPSIGGERWHRWMDTFPALVIHLSLDIVRHDPRAWIKFWNENNLLFCKNDFAPPFTTPIWRYLAGLRDPDIDRQVSRLLQACTPGWTAVEGLDAVLPDTRSTPDSIPSQSNGPVPAPGAGWWEKTKDGAIPEKGADGTGARTSTWRPSSQRSGAETNDPPDWRRRVQQSPITGMTETRRMGTHPGGGPPPGPPLPPQSAQWWPTPTRSSPGGHGPVSPASGSFWVTTEQSQQQVTEDSAKTARNFGIALAIILSVILLVAIVAVANS